MLELLLNLFPGGRRILHVDPGRRLCLCNEIRGTAVVTVDGDNISRPFIHVNSFLSERGGEMQRSVYLDDWQRSPL